MDSIIKLYKKYKKAILPVVGAVGVVVNSAITDNTITGDEWKAIVLTAVTAVWVYFVKNDIVEPPVEVEVDPESYLH